MPYTQEESDVVIRRLPPDIEVTLTEDSRNKKLGRAYLYAPYQQGGARYRLAVHWEDENEIRPTAGQKWVLHPHYTPNGYIIFCRLSRLAPQENPPAPQEDPEKIRRYWASAYHVPQGENARWPDIVTHVLMLRRQGLAEREDETGVQEDATKYGGWRRPPEQPIWDC